MGVLHYLLAIITIVVLAWSLNLWEDFLVLLGVLGLLGVLILLGYFLRYTISNSI